jgi:hypothetical protein
LAGYVARVGKKELIQDSGGKAKRVYMKNINVSWRIILK